MEPRKENQEKVQKAEKACLQFMQLEERATPSVALDVLGLVTADIHLDLQLNVTTPVGANVDLNLTL
ncbi:MAG: hypothetical protein L0241_07885 [Planctomycetia bacterium]|nr:hypothetical protein [Planctomycetia bacterium]